MQSVKLQIETMVWQKVDSLIYQQEYYPKTDQALYLVWQRASTQVWLHLLRFTVQLLQNRLLDPLQDRLRTP